MIIVNAKSIGEPLARWFEDGKPSRVIARFESTIQFQGEDEQLWAITVNPNPGPFRIVASTLPAWNPGMRVHSRFTPTDAAQENLLTPSGGAVVGSGAEVRWDAAALWDPRPNRRALNADERRSAMQQLAESINGLNLPEVHGFWGALGEAWSSFTQALRQQDSATLQATLNRLIGRGPGLTPTGDDFAQAMLVTLRTGDDSDRAAFRTLASEIRTLLPNTTPMSRTFLEEALRGWAFGPLKTLLEALPEVRMDALEQLLQIGASSGVAYALGVLMGLAYEFDRPLSD
ncbi:MAG: DUF2877 domain-containing protein [Chloroflexota bacterium]|nr:DUF2877 domain-containing protein [Chloroflexota bacterium]